MNPYSFLNPFLIRVYLWLTFLAPPADRPSSPFAPADKTPPEQQLPGPGKQQQTSSYPSGRHQTTSSSSTASTRTPPQRPAISRRPPTTRRLAAPGVKYFRRARPVPYESRSHAFAAPR